MPSFAYWFSGAALAAFVVFVGAGYGWYRAALSEQQSAEQKAQDSTKAKGALATKANLQKFYLELGKLLETTLSKGISEADFAAYKANAESIVSDQGQWIYDNMGEAAMARYFDRTGMNAAHVTGAVNNTHNGLLLDQTRFRQNLLAMIETTAWDR